ncbi:tRNA pseudouridine(55) synthase TruB [Halobacillus yeomjeoni]|uniref:tRNA pseudouridine(55) synthase TruB n=1 Tax=Halobacillus yeomjeoni TaxID=311194 RepID=UPI001CD4E787|nr:tRNA pseudouridine(55) synthase TruB [Halobacillus yeomjeoni]MCA0983283.1 tRNA pseudouridine(55) synthase TruB [Halobacillus yeomjeoni]
MDGILPLWKPKGFTSHDCVSKARGMLRTKKIGHTGTLDPDVEGVLPLCVGKATKIVPFLTDTDKVYEAKVKLGFSTETEDATGEVLATEQVNPSLQLEEIEQILEGFRGEITQVPPMYSAVKVKGKKLYEYAREGLEVDRPERQVTIKELTLLSDEVHHEEGTATFSIRVVCSKGTYIRTLCVDIGQALGYPAHMDTLVRTRTADIERADCYTFDEVQQKVDEGHGEQLLLPISKGLSHLATWTVNEDLKPLIKHGRVLDEPEHVKADVFTVQCNGEVLAIYQPHPSKAGKVKPVRVF